MIRNINYYQLGATLYIPATHENLYKVIVENKYQDLKSVVICLEDSIKDTEIDIALNNLKQILNDLDTERPLKIFIRPRNPILLRDILKMRNIYKIDGFSLPKFDTTNIAEYLSIFRNHNDFYFMPILETKDVFSPEKLMEIALALEPFKERVITIRLGSEDILNLIQMKRAKNNMIYDILPFHLVTANVINVFKPLNFNISGPVFNNFEDNDILELEITKEKEYGILNKTIIHPKHIKEIQEMYKPKQSDFEIAERLLTGEEAVFAVEGNMYEFTTHNNWAKRIVSLGKEYGTV